MANIRSVPLTVKQMLSPAVVPDEEAAAQRLAMAQAMQQAAQKGNMPEAGGPVQAKYGIGTALADLGTRLASAYNTRQAQQGLMQAKQNQANTVSSALQNYIQSKATMQDAAGADASPYGAGIEPLADQGQQEMLGARQNLLKAMGPQAVQAAAGSMLSQDMAPARAPVYKTFGENNSGLYEETTGTTRLPPTKKDIKWSGQVAGTVAGQPAYARTREDSPGFFDNQGNVIPNFQPEPKAPLVAIDQKGPVAFDTELGKKDAEAVDKYRTAASSATGLIDTVHRMRDLSPKAMSGGGANTRLALANMLEGFTGVSLSDKVDSSQNFNAAANKAVLEALGGRLGTGVSNTDREFITSTIPKLENSEKARQDLMNYLERRAIEERHVAEAAVDYGYSHQGLKGWNESAYRTQMRKDAAAELERRRNGG